MSNATSFDTILAGGQVYDGTGGPSYRADIGILGDRVAAIGDLSGQDAKQKLDVTGLAVAPGFINMLSHATLLADGRGMNEIAQGVTLQVTGEGWSMGPWPKGTPKSMFMGYVDGEGDLEWQTLGGYLDHLEGKGMSPNVASFVGATTIRMNVLGFENREPNPEELDRMRALTREAMEEGAMGVSTALIYPPAFFAKTEELTELCRVAAEYDGLYISHVRNESSSVEEAVDELLMIARDADIDAEIYHLKQVGKHNWHRLDSIIDKVEQARTDGWNITANMYPYEAMGTLLSACLPPWASEGGHEALLQRLEDEETKQRIIDEMNQDATDWENLYYCAGPDQVVLANIADEDLEAAQGKTLTQVASEWGMSPEEVIFELLRKTGGRVLPLFFVVSEENLHRQIQLPWMSICSDSKTYTPEGETLNTQVHPRAYGSFARVLGEYVRDRKLLSMEQAIHQMTGLPAKNLKLTDRGMLLEGLFADIAIFDPAKVQDRATYEEPHQLASGMVHVFVNGEQVWRDGQHTGAMPGRAVRGPGFKK